MGHVSREYVPYVSTSSAFDMSFTPSTYTEYTYDDIGRNTVIKAPDGKQTTTAYFAGSQQRRTSGVATGVNQETPQTTRYLYDYLGRLRTVKEKNNTITAAYSYDIGDRLSNVQMTGSRRKPVAFVHIRQPRVSQLRVSPRERHDHLPEVRRAWPSWEKRTAGDSAFDLNMQFDSAERLKQIDSRNPYYTPLIPLASSRGVPRSYSFSVART